MRLISWNVNGIRAVLKKDFENIFATFNADVFGIQEVKCQKGQVKLEFPNYLQFWTFARKPGYAGTAVFSKLAPRQVLHGIGLPYLDAEGRVCALEFDDFWFVCVYTPNAQDGLARIDVRMEWDDAFRAFCKGLEEGVLPAGVPVERPCMQEEVRADSEGNEELADVRAFFQAADGYELFTTQPGETCEPKPVAMCGDFNVAHNEIDLKNPGPNRGNAGFSDEERGKFTELVEAERLRTQAWRIRGTGYAYTVPEDAWPVFHRLMEQSAELLRSAWRRHPDIPEVAVLMVRNRREACSSPRPGDTVDDWIARAMDVEVDNLFLYGEMSVFYTDKWHGSPAIRKSLADACQKIERADTTFPYWYVEFATQLRPADENEAFKYYFDSERAKTLYPAITNLIACGVLDNGCEEAMKRYQVLYLHLLGHYEESLAKWRRYGFKSDPGDWGMTHGFPHDLWRVSVLGMFDGAYGDCIMHITKLLRDGSFEECIAELDKFLSESPPLMEKERSYLEEIRDISLQRLARPPQVKSPTPGLLPIPQAEL